MAQKATMPTQQVLQLKAGAQHYLSSTIKMNDEREPCTVSATATGGTSAVADRSPGGRQLIVISGYPGAGKSTLAAPLAEALDFVLLSKDVVKETLFDSIGDFHNDLVATSDALGAAAMSLLWRLAANSRQVVVEANFKAGTDDEANILSLSDRPVEIYCRVSPEVALARYNQRGQSADRHRVHYTRRTSPTILAQYRDPLGLGPVIEVDTTRSVDVLALARRVRSTLSPQQLIETGPPD